MVSTRNYPRGDFPAVEPSPHKRQSRASSVARVHPSTSTTTNTASASASASSSDHTSLAKRAVLNIVANAGPPTHDEVDELAWCHTASNITLLWLAISIPLVFWDSLYILLRPHTMAGGALQWPIWKPYEIYAAIDHVYGWPGWESRNGFGAAQGALNAIELVMYGLYAAIMYNHGVPAASGTGLQASGGTGAWLSGGRKVRGKIGNRALIIGFSAAVMTLSKTMLYYFNEYFSDFHNIKHNDWFTLFLFYIVMNGLWILFPAYMTVVWGSDILHALDLACEASNKAS